MKSLDAWVLNHDVCHIFEAAGRAAGRGERVGGPGEALYAHSRTHARWVADEVEEENASLIAMHADGRGT